MFSGLGARKNSQNWYYSLSFAARQIRLALENMEYLKKLGKLTFVPIHHQFSMYVPTYVFSYFL